MILYINFYNALKSRAMAVHSNPSKLVQTIHGHSTTHAGREELP